SGDRRASTLGLGRAARRGKQRRRRIRRRRGGACGARNGIEVVRQAGGPRSPTHGCCVGDRGFDRRSAREGTRRRRSHQAAFIARSTSLLVFLFFAALLLVASRLVATLRFARFLFITALRLLITTL